MTCQFCQTWNTDDEHRCRRCGRRIRTTTGRVSPRTYPIAATATAAQIEFESPSEVRSCPEASHPETKRREVRFDPEPSPQPMLFQTPVNGPRVISFDSITSPLQREAIHARAAGLSRPAPVPHKVEKVESSPRTSRRSSTVRVEKPMVRPAANQQAFDFQAQQEVTRPPASSIVCDCAVAPAAMRITASVIDSAIVLGGTVTALVPIWFGTHALAFDMRTLLVVGVVALVIFASYRLLWISAGRDSAGMGAAGLRLVDFVGREPGRRMRYLRLAGSSVSVLAAGLGLIWSLVDEDGLTWHDHISGTFPTPDQ